MLRVTFDSLDEIELSAPCAAEYGCLAEFEIKIAIGRATVAIRFSRASAAAAFAERFADMRGYGEPVVTTYAVDLENEAYFWVRADRARRWPHPIGDELLVFFTDNLAMNEYLAATTDIGLHAAVIARGPTVAALVGISTAGKTTTAIAAVGRGFTFYSDERCIFQDGAVVPFLRALTVREGGRTLLLREASLDASIRLRLESMPAALETAIRPSVFFGERAGGPPGSLRALFLIDGHGEAPVIERSSSYAMFPEMLRSMTSADRGIERAVRLAAELRGVAVYRLRLGMPDATVGAIEGTLFEA